MTPTRIPKRRAALFSETRLRALRLGSGLVLMVFVVMHLLNLALALVSLETADAARRWFLLVWQNPAGTLVFYGSVLAHVVLTLRSLYLRRTLRMPVREAMQTAFGLLIPLLLVEHVAGTRIFSSVSGVNTDYEYVIRALWVNNPLHGWRQVLAVLIVWVHGCLGIYFWQRAQASFARTAPWLLAAAVLVPTLALLAFAQTGRDLSRTEKPVPGSNPDSAAVTRGAEAMQSAQTLAYLGFGIGLAGVLVARQVRRRREWRDLVEIRYETGQVVDVPKGHSVLEASRIGSIPHYSACGGRGRCSTCRVRVLKGAENLPEPGRIETLTLGRINAGSDVRLACQLRPVSALTVQPLLSADRESALAEVGFDAKPGREQDLAVLFCDIRGFTALSDRRLPFDVVFLLNRYFALVGQAVEDAGGRLDKFIGDGAMALFGLDARRATACRQAVAAAQAILDGLDAITAELEGDFDEPLRVAIGIHVGPAIVGAMGYGGTMHVTAIGDTVNVASRLEAAAKEFGAAMVVSDEVARLSKYDFDAVELRDIDIRGTRPLSVRLLGQGQPFPAARSARA